MGKYKTCRFKNNFQKCGYLLIPGVIKTYFTIIHVDTECVHLMCIHWEHS